MSYNEGSVLLEKKDDLNENIVVAESTWGTRGLPVNLLSSSSIPSLLGPDQKGNANIHLYVSILYHLAIISMSCILSSRHFIITHNAAQNLFDSSICPHQEIYDGIYILGLTLKLGTSSC